jgi:dihydrofolate synthase / folylpolyglutamate synthase
MAVSSYAEALNYLYTNLPMFQRVGVSAYRGDLENTVALCRALQDPQKSFRAVHIAGTNGKGSTSHMLAAIYQVAGYKTGLYTSPHLKEFTERIRVNGQEISPGFVVDFVNRMEPYIQTIQPSFFEITVAMAFDYFREQQVDIAIIEVGLGGRLDSTNVITPELSLITNISWDHKNILGDTLEKIAFEKAGIIKPSVPVVISEYQQGIHTVFEQQAERQQAPLYVAEREYTVRYSGRYALEGADIYKGEALFMGDVHLQLQGFYQRKNVPGVLKTIEVLNGRGLPVPPEAIRTGLEKVVTFTGLKGRWQTLGEHPLIVCDTGHNEGGVREVIDQLQAQPYARLFMVWGAVNDKDIRDVLRLLPSSARYFFCQARIPRAMEAAELARQAGELGLTGEVVPDVNEAIRRARIEAQADDVIFIGGSTFVVAEIEGL